MPLELPRSHEDLLQAYLAVEKVRLFFKANKLPPTLEAVCEMSHASQEQIQQLLFVAKDIISLVWSTTKSDEPDDYEDVSKRAKKEQLVVEISTAHPPDKRERMVRTALLQHVAEFHTLFLQSKGLKPPPKGLPRSWNASFPLRAVPKIECAPLPAEPIKPPPSFSPQKDAKKGKRDQRILTGERLLGPAPDMFSPAAAIEHLKALPLYKGQIAHVRHISATEAAYADLARPLPGPLANTLYARGIDKLYSHQAHAINAARQGRHVVISTSTSSGKSLVYHIPVIEKILAATAPSSTGTSHSAPSRAQVPTALYLFPTKALAQDQLRSIHELIGAGYLGEDVVPNTLDGDSSEDHRELVRETANIILTNPDMLHASVLPGHDRWARLFRTMRTLVIDEAHMYRGVFGSHVACIIRRLVRVCAMYSNTRLQVICCSATLANPEHLFAQLVPCADDDLEQVAFVSEDGSPHGPRDFVIWNPLRRERAVQRPIFTNIITAEEDGASSAADAQGGAQNTQDVEMMAAVKTEEGTEKSEAIDATADTHAGARADRAAAPLVESLATPPPEAESPTPSPVPTPSPSAPSSSSSQPFDSATYQAAMVETVMELRKASPFETTSPIFETALLLSALVKQKVRTLVFAKVRKVIELLVKYTHEDLEKSGAQDLTAKVRTYRGGYTKEDRRALERELFHGRLLGTVATNALELGVDIGALDATLMLGMPASVASMWQQAGRSGRSGRPALTILVCFNSPVDQFYSHHPELLFERVAEEAICDPENPLVLRQHMLCAALERPLFLGDVFEQEQAMHSGLPYACLDSTLFGVTAREILSELAAEGIVTSGKTGWRLASPSFRPALDVNIRAVEQEHFQVLVEPSMAVIDEVAYNMAFLMIHEGAIFLHQAQTYVITSMDIADRTAHARPISVPYFTKPRDFTDVTILQPIEGEGPVGWGKVQVKKQVFGYRKVQEHTFETIELVPLSLPAHEYITKAMWVEMEPSTYERIEAAGLNWTGGLHAAQHVLAASVPLFILCDGGDINTEHAFEFQKRTRPRHLVVFDARPGGIGVTHAAFKRVRNILATALQMIRECACEEGCPSCVHDLACTKHNSLIDKRAARIMLEDICLKVIGLCE